jgi:hypothetical protein
MLIEDTYIAVAHMYTDTQDTYIAVLILIEDTNIVVLILIEDTYTSTDTNRGHRYIAVLMVIGGAGAGARRQHQASSPTYPY